MSDSPGSTFADINLKSVVKANIPDIPVTANRTYAHQRILPDDLPEPVIEYFHGQNLHVRWGASNSLQQGMDQSLGWISVVRSDLGDEGSDLLDSHFDLQDDGTYTRGDMILQSRTNAAHNMQKNREAELRFAFEDPGEEQEQIEANLSAALPRMDGAGSRALTPQSHIPHVADSVATGISDDTLSAAKEINKAMAARKAQAGAAEAGKGKGGK